MSADPFGDIFRLLLGRSDRPGDDLDDRVLDTLDEAPICHMKVTDGPDYQGPIATVQSLAAALEMSDSAVRRAVHRLKDRGLVRTWFGIDPDSPRRRLYVTAVAA